jgi:hypothetical protein
MPDRGRAIVRIPENEFSPESPLHNASWNKKAFSSIYVLAEWHFVLTLAKIGATFETELVHFC